MMIAAKSLLAVVLFVVLVQNKAYGSKSGSQNNNEDSASIPVIASGKRMHNIMRFGKRPSGGDTSIEHEKRDGASKPAHHSFLYFGKREDEQPSPIPDLVLQYIKDRARNNSAKKNNNGNQHNMMRFGKRYDESYDDYEDYLPIDSDMDQDKRGGHSMMYFGKRTAGHNILSFGKRTAGHSMMSFGKRPVGHNMMSFGKRAAGHAMMSFGKRPAGHAMMSFGKRPAGHTMMSFGKRAAGHAMMSFGKRPAGHTMMSFGKRDDDKRAHAMIHFGKRDGDGYDDVEDYEDDDDLLGEMKRAPHSMIHFGKRSDEEGPIPFFWNPAAQDLYQYGKKTGKNNHAMIHFGKRSVDEKPATSDNATTVSRAKRDLEAVESNEQQAHLAPILITEEDDDSAPEDDLETVINQPPQTTIFYPDGIVDPLPYEMDPLLSISPEYRPMFKKQASKNMFMRFG